MINLIRTLALVALILAPSFPAAAQDAKLPPELVEQISRMAHDRMGNAKTSDGQTIGDERAKALVYPLVPLETREATLVRGHIAGYAKWCGLDWQNGFYLPYMSGVRAANAGWTDYQFAYVGILHGLSMSLAERSKAGQVCTDAEKQRLTELAAQKQ